MPRISRFEKFLRLRRGAKSFESGRAGWLLARYELDDNTLSPVDSVALIAMGPPKEPQNGRVLDPSWTLNASCLGSGNSGMVFTRRQDLLQVEMTRSPTGPLEMDEPSSF